MKTLWGKGAPLNERIATFTVWDDRTLDAELATFDILGSIAHVRTLHRAKILAHDESQLLQSALQTLFHHASTQGLAPGPQDEDIHSTIERLLTAQLGTPAKRVHTARSRNDQVAVDVALWTKKHALHCATTLLELATQAISFATKHAQVPLPGMTHLQPAMPSSVGLWALGFASLVLDDIQHCIHAHQNISGCPLGSAAGYGIPQNLVSLDREYTAKLLGFDHPTYPVTSVQAGRGRIESTLLFALSQSMNTLGKFASDVVLYVNPQWGWLGLDDAYTTGSSIMPQKKNPDVMELVRGQGHTVRASLMEVLNLPASLPTGYHRDYQLFKAPLMRGVRAAEASIDVMSHVFQGLHVNVEACQAAMTPELWATHRALELVVANVPFRDAYKQVAAEVSNHTLPAPTKAHATPDLSGALDHVNDRLSQHAVWCTQTESDWANTVQNLFSSEASP